jgi:hypothetical protein
MKTVSYLVRYRDDCKAQVLNFGPFVSESIADFFQAALPAPKEGGFKKVHPIQPYTSQDGHRAAEVILRERNTVTQ